MDICLDMQSNILSNKSLESLGSNLECNCVHTRASNLIDLYRCIEPLSSHLQMQQDSFTNWHTIQVLTLVITLTLTTTTTNLKCIKRAVVGDLTAQHSNSMMQPRPSQNTHTRAQQLQTALSQSSSAYCVPKHNHTPCHITIPLFSFGKSCALEGKHFFFFCKTV